MKLLTQNSKIKKSKVRTFNFGIPAFLSKTGLKTCPNAGACAKGCYAKAGAYLFSNVANAFEERLRITQTDSFINLMIAEIVATKAQRIRIHDSGDFYSAQYLLKWIEIMESLPNIQFYAYTKQVKMFKDYKEWMPDNFTYVFSYGGLQDSLIDKSKDRHSLVFESIAELKRANYTDTSETDDAAADKSILRIGLVYHGTKSIKKTNWNATKLKQLKG